MKLSGPGHGAIKRAIPEQNYTQQQLDKIMHHKLQMNNDTIPRCIIKWTQRAQQWNATKGLQMSLSSQ